MYKTCAYLVKDEFRPINTDISKHRHRSMQGYEEFCIIGMFLDCHCMMFDTDICTHSCLPGHNCISRQKTASLYELIENPLGIRRKNNE